MKKNIETQGQRDTARTRHFAVIVIVVAIGEGQIREKDATEVEKMIDLGRRIVAISIEGRIDHIRKKEKIDIDEERDRDHWVKKTGVPAFTEVIQTIDQGHRNKDAPYLLGEMSVSIRTTNIGVLG